MTSEKNSEKACLCSAEITSEKIKHGQCELVIYGIRVYCMKKLVAEYPDITDDQKKIAELFSLLDGADLDCNHINDVIEDFVDALYSLP